MDTKKRGKKRKRSKSKEDQEEYPGRKRRKRNYQTSAPITRSQAKKLRESKNIDLRKTDTQMKSDLNELKRLNSHNKPEDYERVIEMSAKFIDTRLEYCGKFDFWKQCAVAINGYTKEREEKIDIINKYFPSRKIDTTSFTFFLNRGRLWKMLGFFNFARNDFLDSLKQNNIKEQRQVSYVCLGKIDMRMGMIASAENYFTKAIERGSLESYLFRSQCRKGLGKRILCQKDLCTYHFRCGVEFKLSEKYNDAVKSLNLALNNVSPFEIPMESAVKIFPSPKEVCIGNILLNRSFCFSKLKLFHKSIKDCIYLITKIRSDLIEPYNRIANCYFWMQMFEKAVVYYTRAIDLNPKNRIFYGNRARTYERLRNFEAALIDFKKENELEETKDRMFHIGFIYEKEYQDYANAVKWYTKTLDFIERKKKVKKKKGRSNKNENLTSTSPPSKPIPSFAMPYGNQRLPSNTSPEHLEKLWKIKCLLNRSYCMRNLDRFQESISDCTEILKIDGSYVEAYNRIGITYFRMRKFRDSVNWYTKAIRLSDKIYAGLPPKERVRNVRYINTVRILFGNRGRSYEKLGELENALRDFKQENKIEPSGDRCFQIGKFYYLKMQNLSKAVEWYTKAISMDPLRNVFYFERAFTYRKMRKFNEAIKDCLVVLSKIDPNDYRAFNQLGICYYQLKQYGRAIKYYNECIKRKPDYFISYVNRGYSNWHVKDMRITAIEDLKKGIEICTTLKESVRYQKELIEWMRKMNWNGQVAHQIGILIGMVKNQYLEEERSRVQSSTSSAGRRASAPTRLPEGRNGGGRNVNYPILNANEKEGQDRTVAVGGLIRESETDRRFRKLISYYYFQKGCFLLQEKRCLEAINDFLLLTIYARFDDDLMRLNRQNQQNQQRNNIADGNAEGEDEDGDNVRNPPDNPAPNNNDLDAFLSERDRLEKENRNYYLKNQLKDVSKMILKNSERERKRYHYLDRIMIKERPTEKTEHLFIEFTFPSEKSVFFHKFVIFQNVNFRNKSFMSQKSYKCEDYEHRSVVFYKRFLYGCGGEKLVVKELEFVRKLYDFSTRIRDLRFRKYILQNTIGRSITDKGVVLEFLIRIFSEKTMVDDGTNLLDYILFVMKLLEFFTDETDFVERSILETMNNQILDQNEKQKRLKILKSLESFLLSNVRVDFEKRSSAPPKSDEGEPEPDIHPLLNMIRQRRAFRRRRNQVNQNNQNQGGQPPGGGRRGNIAAAYANVRRRRFGGLGRLAQNLLGNNNPNVPQPPPFLRFGLNNLGNAANNNNVPPPPLAPPPIQRDNFLGLPPDDDDFNDDYLIDEDEDDNREYFSNRDYLYGEFFEIAWENDLLEDTKTLKLVSSGGESLMVHKEVVVTKNLYFNRMFSNPRFEEFDKESIAFTDLSFKMVRMLAKVCYMGAKFGRNLNLEMFSRKELVTFIKSCAKYQFTNIEIITKMKLIDAELNGRSRNLRKLLIFKDDEGRERKHANLKNMLSLDDIVSLNLY